MNKILSIVVLCVLMSASAWGQANPPLKVREADGTPSKSGINTLVVSNGSLSISGTTATVTTNIPELSMSGGKLVSTATFQAPKIELALPSVAASSDTELFRFPNNEAVGAPRMSIWHRNGITTQDTTIGFLMGSATVSGVPGGRLLWGMGVVDNSTFSYGLDIYGDFFPQLSSRVNQIVMVAKNTSHFQVTDTAYGTPRASFTSSGVVINRGTSFTVPTPTAQLEVVSGSASRVGFRVDTASSPSVDIAQFTNNGSNRWTVNSASTATTNTLTAPSGATSIGGVLTENITLSTAGTTTDSTIDLPANSIILSVSARVTTTIETATDWKLGDSTIDDRFTSANATLTAGTTGVGINQWKADRTTAGQGAYQDSAAKVRITTSGTPTAGAIRITIHYIQLTAPTS